VKRAVCPSCSRDHVARIVREIKAGVAPHGGVYLDIS
jgi:hypothetical protein